MALFGKKSKEDKPKNNKVEKKKPLKKTNLKKKEKPEKKIKTNKKVPRSMSTKKKKSGYYLALDIGNRSIKSVVGEYNNGRFKIVSMQSIEQEENVYDCGLINDEKAIGNAISTLIRDYKIKEKDTILTIESFEVIKREMSIPVLDKQDAISAITFEIGEYLPIDIDKYVLQYKEIDRFVDNGIEKMNILVYAFPQKIAEQYFELLRNCGLNPVVLDIQSNCVEKLFSMCKINETNTNTSTNAIIDIGNTGINLTIIKDGKHEFNRIIKMNSSIKNTLILSGTCNKNEVEDIIDKYSFENIFSENISPQHVKIQDEIIYLADLWIADILKLFQYYTSRNNNNKIDNIFIYGGGAVIKNIEFYIGSRIGIQTRAIDSIEGVQLPNPAISQELIKYVNCIGALIGR